MPRLLLVVLLLWGIGGNSHEASFYVKNKLFLGGYDPVAYLLENKAQKGSSKYSLTYKGVVVHFKKLKYKRLFQQKPEKYLPRYRGWCAYSMSKNGDIVPSNPEAFKIVDQKVYLFHDDLFVNTLDRWNQVEENLQIQKANKNWLSGHH